MTGTWHHGIVATWWDEFNRDGPEIEFFRRFVEAGQPALDAGCGAGRLLIPYLEAGLDVDGSDISEDMLERCRSRAEAKGLSPRLYAQALHELDLPRAYRTIVLCGTFGLGILAGAPQIARYNCDTGVPQDDVEGTTTANSGLSFANGVYQYNWKTARNQTGCFRFELRLADGSLHVALFRLR